MTDRILIVRLSAVGDLVHGMPLARSVRLLHPEAEILWAVQPGPAPLLEHHPWVDRTVLFPRHGPLGRIAAFLLAVARLHVDLAIDLQGNLKSGLVLAATGARDRVGLSLPDIREPLSALATNRRALPARGPHSVDRTLALCRFLGDPAPRPEFGLAPTPRERTAARSDLLRIPSPVAAISVGDESDLREWTDDGYETVAARLLEHGVSVLVLAGPRHADRARRIAARSGAECRPGTTDLRGLLAHLAVLAERPGSALLACDSAPAHLAVAVGLPVLVLEGPQDSRRTGPWGRPDSVMTAGDPPSCAPCRRRRCRLTEEPRACMRRIDPEPVFHRLLRTMGPPGRPSG